MIITIDGPIATGKSTIAKRLADKLHFIYFDTGAMYRSLTYALLKAKIDLDNSDALEAFLADYTFDIKVVHGEKRYLVGDEDITDQIRKAEVTSHVSKVSAIKSVRSKLVALQRVWGASGVDAVFEGRDLGTVVFPNAKVKIFLTGRTEVRAKRRYDEMHAKFPDETQDLTIEKMIAEINRRDLYDSTREISPLKQASDAYVIDTSDLSLDEIVDQICKLIQCP